MNMISTALQHRAKPTHYTLCLKRNDTDVAHYNFDADQPILIIFLQRCCWESMLSNDDLLSHLS